MTMLLRLAALCFFVGQEASVRGACSRDRSYTFEATVLVEHDGWNMDEINESERLELGEAFLETYNKMNEASEAMADLGCCDNTYGRFITSVTLNHQETLDEHTGQQPRPDRKDLFYHVTVATFEEKDDYSLFDVDETTARKLATVTEAITDETCDCNSAYPDRGPTEEEFSQRLHAEIVDRFGDEDLLCVATCNNVLELKPMMCTFEAIMHQSVLEVEFDQEPVVGDKEVIESSIVEAYNNQAKHYCGEYEEWMLDAESMPDDPGPLRRRRRLAKKKKKRYNTSNKKKKKKAAVFEDAVRRLEALYTVSVGDEEIECTYADLMTMVNEGTAYTLISKRNGSPEPNSPDQPEGLLAENSTSVDQFANYTWTYNQTCWCPVRPKEGEAPTMEEFAKEFNQTLWEQAIAGNLAQTYGVSAVVEESASGSGVYVANGGSGGFGSGVGSGSGGGDGGDGGSS